MTTTQQPSGPNSDQSPDQDSERNSRRDPDTMQALHKKIRVWAAELGFQQVGISDTDLSQAEQYLFHWLDKGYQGEMSWMASHGEKRSRPEQLVPGTLRIISVRMDYQPANTLGSEQVLQSPDKAFISRYALGRDYHKLMRKRLQQLASKIEQHSGPFGYRVFVDSAPVLEKALAAKAGLGWIGKHTNLLNREAGSWFFLGEIYTDLPLSIDTAAATENHCGTCRECIDICPTRAIIAPYEVDARRCISYLTIELKGSIPVEFRKPMGNRIYGCDDCQLVCPWNRFAKTSKEADFQPRHALDAAELVELFGWSEEEFLSNLQGSAIRRIGYESWLRNIAVALGNAGGNALGNAGGNTLGNTGRNAQDPAGLNADSHEKILKALNNRLSHTSPIVREHVQWALQQHRHNK